MRVMTNNIERKVVVIPGGSSGPGEATTNEILFRPTRQGL